MNALPMTPLAELALVVMLGAAGLAILTLNERRFDVPELMVRYAS